MTDVTDDADPTAPAPPAEPAHTEETVPSSADASTLEPSPPANVLRVDFKRAQRSAPQDPTAPQKHAVFSRFIEKGKVMVTVDARRPGVSVPRQFAEEQQLNLDFSERFGLADFRYDERGVRASLSFNRQPFFCDVPWSAVYALFSHVDNERLTWARSLPVEILDQLPEASIEHLERVLELQVERLLRHARAQHERELKSVETGQAPADDVADVGMAAEAEADQATKDAQALLASTTAADEPDTVPELPRDDDGGPKPPPPTRPGLRLVKS